MLSLVQSNSPTTRSATPIPTEAASAESIAADDALLQQFAIAITDIKAIESQVMKLWREELTAMLPESTPGDEEGVTPEGQSSTSQASANLLTPPIP